MPPLTHICAHVCSPAPAPASSPAPAKGMRTWVLASVVLICWIVYATTAITGLAKFGNTTPGNILAAFNTMHGGGRDAGSNSSNSSTAAGLVDSAKLLMATHIALAYPVVLFPCLRAIDSMFGAWGANRSGSAYSALGSDSISSNMRGSVGASGGDGSINRSSVDSSIKRRSRSGSNGCVGSGGAAGDHSLVVGFGGGSGSFWKVALKNFAVVCSTATLAVFLPKVQSVFSIVGGLFGSLIVFVFPCAMRLKEDDQLPPLTWLGKVGSVSLMVAGIFVAVAATIEAVKEASHAAHRNHHQSSNSTL